MTYTYTPRGVCSRKMTVELENGVIKSVSVEGGCNGNLQGISRLVVGMNAQDAIERMKGIHCGPKPTSCPDQMAHALEEAAQGVQETVALIHLITTAASSQAETVGQLVVGIDQISSVVQTTAATAEESAAASEELSGQSQVLKSLVGQFTLRTEDSENT